MFFGVDDSFLDLALVKVFRLGFMFIIWIIGVVLFGGFVVCGGLA